MSTSRQESWKTNQGTNWISSGWFNYDFGDFLHQEFLASKASQLFEILLPVLFLRALTFKIAYVSNQNDAKNRKKKIRTTKKKEKIIVSDWHHSVPMSKSNLTEFPDFHILVAFFGIIIVIAFFSCSVISAPALLCVLLETPPFHTVLISTVYIYCPTSWTKWTQRAL